jgi:hypothetical protein
MHSRERIGERGRREREQRPCKRKGCTANAMRSWFPSPSVGAFCWRHLKICLMGQHAYVHIAFMRLLARRKKADIVQETYACVSLARWDMQPRSSQSQQDIVLSAEEASGASLCPLCAHGSTMRPDSKMKCRRRHQHRSIQHSILGKVESTGAFYLADAGIFLGGS